ncbi:MAG: hypothetical protein ABFS32_20005 [Bacteroidota bacterium]
MRTIITILFLAILIGCNTKQDTTTTEAGLHKITVEEVIHTSGYTYLRGIESGESRWFAIPKMPGAKEGEVYYYQGGDEMLNFKSKELDRVFESIFFLEGVQISNTITTHTKIETDVDISTPDGGISIKELLENKNEYDGKTVKLRGLVVKYNSGIMGKNWIHIQDQGPETDITVTTDDVTSVGEVIIIEGKVALNKDIGAGYFYEILIEDAEIIKESSI